jgi:nucleoside-diphosphate-sugar epimerase
MGKLLCEIVLSNTAKVSNLKYQIIRPFNISGARQLKTGGFVLPTFVQQALKNEPITVYGTGQQVRAFTHAEDIINGVYLTSMAKDEDYNETWNVGTPDNTSTIQKMAELVKILSNSNSEIAHIDPKTLHGSLYEEAWDKIPNSEKLQTRLGWKAKWSIPEIIQDVVNYYK